MSRCGEMRAMAVLVGRVCFMAFVRYAVGAKGSTLTTRDGRRDRGRRRMVRGTCCRFRGLERLFRLRVECLRYGHHYWVKHNLALYTRDSGAVNTGRKCGCEGLARWADNEHMGE